MQNLSSDEWPEVRWVWGAASGSQRGAGTVAAGILCNLHALISMVSYHRYLSFSQYKCLERED